MVLHQRVLPESELEAVEAGLIEKIAEAERELATWRTQLGLIRALKSKLVMTESSNNTDDGDDEDDDGERGPTPTRMILDLLQSRPGLTRDEIFDSLAPKLRTTTSKNPRNMVINILNRLDKRYEKVKKVGERYYPANLLPAESRYSAFGPPPFEDDDDLPF